MVIQARRNRTLIIAAIVIAVAGVVTVTLRLAGLGGPDPMEEGIQRLRESRATVDSCQFALDQEQGRFRAYDHAVDSMRSALDAYQSEDGRVPAADYEAYLGAFRAYNEAVPAWRIMADSLRIHRETCAAIVRRHNALADTLRALSADGG